MEPHSELGTQRLELPVSRTTLNSWGGVPIAIVLKSSQILAGRRHDVVQTLPTLSIQEVLDRNVMRTLLKIDGCMFEDILRRTTHDLLSIFVAKGIYVVANIGSALSKNFGQRLLSDGSIAVQLTN